MNKVVYIHRKATNGEIFYVGLGDPGRSKSKCRTDYWKRIVNKYGYEIELVAENLTLEDAQELEVLLISIIGRKDLGTGPLVNMTEGGEGTLGRIVTEETRRKLSIAHTGKVLSMEHRKKLSESGNGSKHWLGKNLSEEHRKKLSDSHKGKIVSEETKLKLSNSNKGNTRRSIEINQIDSLGNSIIWNSTKEAGETLNISRSSILRSCASGKMYKNSYWSRKN